MSLDDLEKELYEFNESKKPEKDADKNADVSTKKPQEFGGWENDDDAIANKKSGKAKNAIKIAYAILGIAIIATVSVVFLRYGGDSSGIVVEIQSPDSVSRGVPFEVVVQIANGIDNFTEEGVVSINTTSGLLNAENLSGKTIITEEVGDLGGGSLVRKTFKLFPLGDINSAQKINVRFSFVSSKTKYEIEKDKSISIGDPAIKLTVEKPEQVMSGSDFKMIIGYENGSDSDFSDMALKIEYPSGYTFKEATYNPASLNNYWKLGEVKAGTKGSIQITGSIDATDASSFDFPVSAFVAFLGEDRLVAEKTVNVFIAPSPIAMRIIANGNENFIAHAGSQIKYSIRYENKSGISLADAVIKAELDGDMFDLKTLVSNGSFDSRTNTITWTASKVSELTLLDPGATGEVNFTVKLLSELPVKRSSDKNFILKVNSSMESPSVPYYISGDKTTGFALLETKVAGTVSFDAKAFYRDSLAQIINSGVLPPKVNQAVQYTIHWNISNYGSELRDVTVKASLESGVRWTGVVKSNMSVLPTYDSRTNEVTWKVEKIQANRGLFDDPAEAVFQVEVIPNITQVGRAIPILSTSVFSGTDNFTDSSVSDTDTAITTLLPDDKTVGRNDGIVVQ